MSRKLIMLLSKKRMRKLCMHRRGEMHVLASDKSKRFSARGPVGTGQGGLGRRQGISTFTLFC